MFLQAPVRAASYESAVIRPELADASRLPSLNPRIPAPTACRYVQGRLENASLNFTLEKFGGSEAAVGNLLQRAHMLFRKQLRKVYDLMPELNVGADRGFVPIKSLAIIIVCDPQSNSHLVVEGRRRNEPHYQLPFIRNAPFF